MGDRANVYLPRTHRENDQDIERGVYLYTHWGGYDLPVVLRDALKKCGPLDDYGSRWNDPAYLNRVIFCQMVGKDNWNDTTGFGISTQIEDNEHPVIRVDVAAQRVSWDGKTNASWSFADYCGLTDDDLECAWLGPEEHDE